MIRDYADDETGTETVTTLQMHVGGVKPASGIHWHIAQQIEYIATDRERQTIPYVKFTDRNGNVKEYTVDGVTQGATGARRAAIDGLHGLPQPSGTHVRALAGAGG